MQVPLATNDLITGTLSGASPFYCTFVTSAGVAAGMKENTAYGLRLAGTSTAAEGAYAPIGL